MKQTDENAVIVLRRLREHFKDDAIGREVLSYTINRLKGLIENPTVEQKHGHWIRNAPNRKFMQEMKNLGFAKGMGVDSIFYTCSECNLWGSPYMKYCSHCGAKMDDEVMK